MSINPFSNFSLESAFDGVELQFLDAAPRRKYNPDAGADAAPVQDTRKVGDVDLPVWDVELLAKDPEHGYSSLTVRVASKVEPSFPPTTSVRLVHAMGTAWKLANNNGGFSVRADGIQAVSAQRVNSPADEKPAARAQAAA
ncbi:MAG: hypothetical protein ACRDZQ_15150 [Acidimicrobiales bacterium]